MLNENISYDYILRDEKLYCSLYLYKRDTGIELTLSDIENYLAEEYLANGELKTYYDDPKIMEYVDWYYYGYNADGVERFYAICRSIGAWYAIIDLDDYSYMSDIELVYDVPIYKIRNLQDTYENDPSILENRLQRSAETLDATFEIFEYLLEVGEIEFEIYDIKDYYDVE